ncbi:TIGR00366 family protein [Halopiger aswanensis]|uniref:Short subunit fatty acids transporter n=1 Tax=Halopiger aswanensis TaxID=148449 RepID=A0A3R7EF17_9EURY|nr:TIGR00366 family protein [Halopiger aswanensis]RKD95249.1 short subunit fatty acids transporter [Halopiger aswanensis]
MAGEPTSSSSSSNPNPNSSANAGGTAGETRADRYRDAFVPTLGRYFPEALSNAVVLAALALLVTVPFLEPMTQLELLGTGFFDLFSVQMLLILYWVLGAALVESPRVGAVLDRFAAALPTSQAGVIYATGVLSLLLGWLNWALGLIGGIYLGQRLCRRARENGIAVHYPAVLTASLLALVLTNQGLSSPGGLMLADESGLANFMVDEVGSIAMSEFLLHPVNLVSTAVFVLTLPALLVVLAPDADAADGTDDAITTLGERNALLDRTESIAAAFDHYSPAVPPADWEVGDRLENSRLITALAVAVGLISAGWYFGTGGRLTLPWLAFTLLILGLAVQGPPMAFRKKTEDATRWALHVAVPFLLYAGVWALLDEAGLYGTIGDAIAATGVPAAASYVVAFALGLLVPDPGSLWVLQGPAVAAADVDLVGSLVATMYGAGLSNLWLGFLFASLLSLYGFDWREFVRYAGAVTVYVTAVVVGLLLLF